MRITGLIVPERGGYVPPIPKQTIVPWQNLKNVGTQSFTFLTLLNGGAWFYGLVDTSYFQGSVLSLVNNTDGNLYIKNNPIGAADCYNNPDYYVDRFSQATIRPTNVNFGLLAFEYGIDYITPRNPVSPSRQGANIDIFDSNYNDGSNLTNTTSTTRVYDGYDLTNFGVGVTSYPPLVLQDLLPSYATAFGNLNGAANVSAAIHVSAASGATVTMQLVTTSTKNVVYPVGAPVTGIGAGQTGTVNAPQSSLGYMYGLQLSLSASGGGQTASIDDMYISGVV